MPGSATENCEKKTVVAKSIRRAAWVFHASNWTGLLPSLRLKFQRSFFIAISAIHSRNGLEPSERDISSSVVTYTASDVWCIYQEDATSIRPNSVVSFNAKLAMIFNNQEVATLPPCGAGLDEAILDDNIPRYRSEVSSLHPRGKKKRDQRRVQQQSRSRCFFFCTRRAALPASPVIFGCLQSNSDSAVSARSARACPKSR